MTPNFALDLSEDGIVLLHRAPNGSGWFREGRVDFASDDIAEGLAKLRTRAIELEGEEFRSKLILPSSQLLFTTVSSDTDIPTALSERTPYRADQLSYATSGEGDNVKVVAVALETLGEAEGFITPHGLNPVGFTAIPSPGQFNGEPMLGITLLGDEEFIPDDEPVKIIEKPTFLPDPVAPVDEAEEVSEEPSQAKTDADVETKAADEPDEIDGKIADSAKDSSEDEAEDAELAIGAADKEIESAKSDAKKADTDGGETKAAPAAFSSRRSGLTAERPEETGSRVTRLAARIAVPDSAPKLGGAPAKPRPAPKIKTGAAAKPAVKPAPVVPPAASPRIKTIPPAAVAAQLAKTDPMAKLAAKQSRGKPRFLGLILTVILLACLGLAALLSSYVLPDNAVSRLLGLDGTPETEIAEGQTDPELIEGPEAELAFEEELDITGLPLDQTLPDLSQPQPSFTEEEPVAPPATEPITEAEAETAYAATGIWQHASALPSDAVQTDAFDDLYIASLDPDPAFEDAPALLPQAPGGGEVELVAFTPPPPPGVVFDIDERGLVRATPQGAMNPDGVMVFLGAPPIRATQRPGEATSEASPPEAEATDNRLAGIRPQQRPDDLVERQERAVLGGLSRAELSGIRPQQRPQSAQARAQAIARALAEVEAASQAEAEAAILAATPQAVGVSLRAQQRPNNFDSVVASARSAPRTATTAQIQTASASTASAGRATGPAVARSSRASPTGPTQATVARAATDSNAIALGKVALVGVFGTSSNRRALVRMPNGRFKKVSIGDRVDGGRVAAIDSSSLRYTKGGRTVTLTMPNS